MTFAGRFLCVFFLGAAAVVEALSGVAAAIGSIELSTSLESLPGLLPDTAMSAGFEDCLEQALNTSKSPRIAKPANKAAFCWRDQAARIVPENVLLVPSLAEFWFVDFWFVDTWFVDFQIVAILSPPLRWRSRKGYGKRVTNLPSVDAVELTPGPDTAERAAPDTTWKTGHS
jgi:hypothetical protein